MSDEQRPQCHACSSPSSISLRMLPNGRDAQPITVHACPDHYRAAKAIGRILGGTVYGDPVAKKLD